MYLQKENINVYYLSIGTNLGNKKANIYNAINYIDSLGLVFCRSSLKKTKPWGFESKNSFINMCVGLKSDLSPVDLLSKIKSYENEQGRIKIDNNYSDRIIDIDIILANNICLNENSLVIPHPHFAVREFVLQPLNEIASHVIVPGTEKSVKEIYDNFKLNVN